VPAKGLASADSIEAMPQPITPQPPTNVTACPGNAQVTVSSTASSGATSYNVKRATTNGGPYTTVASPSSTTYTDTGLTNGTTYHYVVTAINSAGESANSSQASATPQVPTTAAPTGSTANATKPGSINVRWTQSTTPGVTQNRVYRRTGTGTYAAITTLAATTSYVDITR
jgi:fibronectin type 3 domain-containing protein